MSEMKYCPKCGAPVESDHIFCASCGNNLQNNASAPTQSTGATENANTQAEYNNTFNQATANGFNTVDRIEGIPEAEIKDYVGKNSEGFFRKFIKFSFGGKASWNWPVFVLTLIGLPFVWFFHRKMNKVGAVVLAVWLAITVANGAVVGGILNAMEEPIDGMVAELVDMAEDLGMYDSEYVDDNVLDEYEYRSNAVIQEYIDDVIASAESGDFVWLNLLSQLFSYINIAMLIVLPIFADYWYFKKAMADMHTLNANGFPNAYEVKAKGGTSTGMTVLTVIVGIVVPIIVAAVVIVPFIMNIFEAFYNIM